MCGIAGYFSLNPSADRAGQLAIANSMQQAIAHRGPDAQGIWQDPDMPLALAHRRLAIIDLSKDGEQPMHSASGRFVITYNGEIYNYLELKEELASAGASFQTQTDTEVMLVAFEVWGIEKALSKFNGMFAFALFDRESNQLYFARDRFGKKPLYVGWAGDNLAFASELKAFHAHPDFSKSIHTKSLTLYMKYSYLHAPHTIYKGVWQLLPGSYLCVDLNDLNKKYNLANKFLKYWDLPSIVCENGKVDITEQEALEDFEAILERAVQLRMLSDVPLGAFLSGGIDSSAIVALMQKQSSLPIKTFSVGFKESSHNEAEKAKAIAAHIGTDHQEFYVGAQDALNIVPQLATMYDEPFADSSQVPTHLISKMAKSYVSVALTGDGGDEILGGYERHTHIPALWSKVGWMPEVLKQTLGFSASLMPEAALGKLKSSDPNFGRKLKRAAQIMARKDQESIYDYLLAAWDKPERTVVNGQLPNYPLKQRHTWSDDLSFAEEMMLSDCISYRSDDLMVKTDRASMAVSLEVRAPLMDFELAEFCWSLPEDMKIKGLQGKWLLRKTLEKYVPNSLTDGPKQHFGLPLDEWLKGPLKSWGDDLLSESNLKKTGYLNADLISKSWQYYQQGKRGSVSPKALWTALMFQSWADHWI